MDKPDISATVAFLVVSLLGGGYCLHRLATATLSSNETLLLSVLLTLLSITGSWIASKYYSELSFGKSLRLFALKAAEKVTTLSKELDRLSTSLQEDLKPEDYATPNEEILAKNLALENAIYAIQTLKSMNDGSLSDWQGVIGDEISAKLKGQAEQQETLKQIVERLETLSSEATESDAETETVDTETEKIRAQMNSISSDVKMLAAQIGGTPVPRAERTRHKKQPVQLPCPQCGQIIGFKQRTTPGGRKAVDCKHCGAALYSQRSETEFNLIPRVRVNVDVVCPECAKTTSVEVDPVAGSISDLACGSCATGIKLVWRDNKPPLIRRKPSTSPPGHTTDFLKRVESEMGPQPWPKGRARQAAAALKVPINAVHLAVQDLIKKGVFKPQIEGTLYVPEK